ncbi:hypothetical protein KAM347_24420 [Aeromonas caviae]|uniref:Uncharacterized protein n=1 Tax=Aeromonas caviae TaxID=648 RepID=A0AAV4YKF9_AERCA|nr:hypothetical protein KAM341_23560 [Aeromonas caviae]GJA37130.1 hypothetical protein KAM342_23730 [Aeromonas caviae]GJA41648.1 hypothetical protein KAM343_24440 [Aeromonas caviae]GJA50651.1 hypothetical protein KAM347_24420 [Aeromonas caviae]GJA59532.1 hypothetical protein KAM350_25250 [Aeromonas caviae]
MMLAGVFQPCHTSAIGLATQTLTLIFISLLLWLSCTFCTVALWHCHATPGASGCAKKWATKALAWP